MSRLWHGLQHFSCVFQLYLTLVAGWTIVHSASLYSTRLSKKSAIVIACALVSFSR